MPRYQNNFDTETHLSGLKIKSGEVSKVQTYECHVCKSIDLSLINEQKGFSSVTSDCKVWRTFCNLAYCNDCGISQTIVDEKWFQETSEIYENYEIYHQGDSCDHFIIKDGKNTRRSNILVEELIQGNWWGNPGLCLKLDPVGATC